MPNEKNQPKSKPQSQFYEVLQVERASINSLRRVLVVGHECLLEQGVTHLLTTRKNLEIFQSDDSDPDDLLLKVEQIHPDVILLCHAEPDTQNRLLAMLDGVSSFTDMRLIFVQIQNIDLRVYHHKQWFSASQTAFFPLVFGENLDIPLD